MPVTFHASTVLTNCCVWLGSVCVQIELGDYVTINEPKYNEEGEQCEDLVVARITEIVYTISGERRIGINWMYRITVGACRVLRASRLTTMCAWCCCWQWRFLAASPCFVHNASSALTIVAGISCVMLCGVMFFMSFDTVMWLSRGRCIFQDPAISVMGYGI